jgi:hypothetical protein
MRVDSRMSVLRNRCLVLNTDLAQLTHPFVLWLLSFRYNRLFGLAADYNTEVPETITRDSSRMQAGPEKSAIMTTGDCIARRLVSSADCTSSCIRSYCSLHYSRLRLANHDHSTADSTLRAATSSDSGSRTQQSLRGCNCALH